MAESLENFLMNQGSRHGLDINQTIEVHKHFVDMKKICLQVYHEKNMAFDESLINCLEKVKHSIRLLEKTANKI
jgi:hypothetical protein